MEVAIQEESSEEELIQACGDEIIIMLSPRIGVFYSSFRGLVASLQDPSNLT